MMPTVPLLTFVYRHTVYSLVMSTALHDPNTAGLHTVNLPHMNSPPPGCICLDSKKGSGELRHFAHLMWSLLGRNGYSCCMHAQ